MFGTKINILYLYIYYFYLRKGIFDEYCQITSLVSDEIVSVHKEIETCVQEIKPSVEYEDYIEKNRFV